MKLINRKLSELNYKKVSVLGTTYTLYVDGQNGSNAHILFIDKDESVKGEIQAFIKDCNVNTKEWDSIITGYFDMCIYDSVKDIRSQDIKELEAAE